MRVPWFQLDRSSRVAISCECGDGQEVALVRVDGERQLIRRSCGMCKGKRTILVERDHERDAGF
jgi:urease beta subunit